MTNETANEVNQDLSQAPENLVVRIQDEFGWYPPLMGDAVFHFRNSNDAVLAIDLQPGMEVMGAKGKILVVAIFEAKGIRQVKDRSSLAQPPSARKDMD